MYSAGFAPTSLSSALEGGTGARDALDRLGLARPPLLVLGVATVGSEAERGCPGARAVSDQVRLSDAFAMHLSAVHPRSAAALGR